VLSELVNEKRGITIEMSLKLIKHFGTSPQLWLNIRNQFDLYKVSVKKHYVTEEIQIKGPKIVQETKVAIQVKLRKQTPIATPLSKKIIS